MAKSKYPYQALMVGPSMAIREVSVTGPAYTYSSSAWERLAGGRAVNRSDLYKTREAALGAAEEKMLAQEFRLEKQKFAVAKRRATLEKAKAAAA